VTDKHWERRERSKTHKVIVTLLIAAAATVTVCGLTWAVDDVDSDASAYRRGGMGPGAMHGGPVMGAGPGGKGILRALDRHLDLTAEQHAAIEQIIDASRAEGQVLRADMQTLFEQIRTSVEQDGFDEDRVRIMIENQTPQMVDMMMLRIRTMARIREQLTPAQQEVASAMFESRRGRFMH